MHGSKSINTNNISTIQSNAIPSSIPPLHQSIDYEEEEELNSWIWKSCRIPRHYMERGEAVRGAALRGVATESLRKEFAALMAQKGNNAATRGIHRGVCITHGAKVKRCSFEDKVPWIVKRGF
jgi:hypothetical protein